MTDHGSAIAATGRPRSPTAAGSPPPPKSRREQGVAVPNRQMFNVAFALSTTLLHLGSEAAAYSSCQFHHL